MSRIMQSSRHMRSQKKSMVFASDTNSTSNADTETLKSDIYSGTMSLPQNFTTVSIDKQAFNDIQNINTNASHRSMSSNMYEDTNNTTSNYKNNIIANMQKEVLEQANLLCQYSKDETRSYTAQVSSTLDTSQGAYNMNTMAAQNIVTKYTRK